MLHIQFRDVGNTEFIPHHYKNSFFSNLIGALTQNAIVTTITEEEGYPCVS